MLYAPECGNRTRRRWAEMLRSALHDGRARGFGGGGGIIEMHSLTDRKR